MKLLRMTLTGQLEDLDFADGVFLTSATQNQMQRKTEKRIVSASKLGIK